MPETTRRSFLVASFSTLGFAGLPLATAAGRWFAGDDVDRFLSAVRSGDMGTVRTMLETNNALVEARDERGLSAFALALLGGHADVGKILTSHGYTTDLHEAALALDWDRVAQLAEASPDKVNAAHPIGGSAMMAAATGGAGSDIWRIYSQAGDPNARPNGMGKPSALRAALDVRDLGIAELTAAALLANGAHAHSIEPRGTSPLHAAAARGSSEIAEMLIRKGADVDAVDDRGRTPIDVARESRHDDVAALLESHHDIPRDHNTSRYAYDVHGKLYSPPDLEAIDIRERGNVVGAAHFKMDVVREAVEADPRLVHSIATTTEGAVEACAHTGQKPIVEFLLERGAPYSLLTATVLGDEKRMRELLVEDPLRIHERGPHDFALLWYPIIGRCPVDLLALLVDAGAEIEKHHHLGTTALHFAAMAGSIEHAAWLIEHGADVNRVGRKFSAEGDTPLQLARKREHADVVTLLEQHGATA